MARGTLRIYLGAAPGVGKTFAMLNEGRRRHDRGTDVVVGFVETHGRPQTAEQIADLEVVAAPEPRVPRDDVRGDGRRRHPRPPPAQALSTSSPTRTFPARATRSDGRTSRSCSTPGIDVISTLNIQHLESVNDVVERITGIAQRETIPDAIVRKADQIELVDMTPEALRRRMAHGNIYKPEKIDAALGELLPSRQPRRAPRARAAVGGRPGRRGARGVPRAPRHHRALGDTGARARRRSPARPVPKR